MLQGYDTCFGQNALLIYWLECGCGENTVGLSGLF